MKVLLKALFNLCTSLALLIAPTIWSIAYIKDVIIMGFERLPGLVNFIGILSILAFVSVAQGTVRLLDKIIDQYRKNKMNRMS